MLFELYGIDPDVSLLTGIYNVPATESESHIWPILFALAQSGTQITSLRLWNIEWPLFLRPDMYGHVNVLGRVFGTLKQLYISGSGSLSMDGRTSELQTIMQIATSLEELSMKFGGDNSSEDDEFNQSIFNYVNDVVEEAHLIPRLIWSRNPRSLTLRGMSYTFSEIKQSLTACARTLRHLQIDDLALFPEGQTGTVMSYEKRGCLVALFHFMQESLQLESIRLNGRFQNNSSRIGGSGVRWHFS